MDNAALLSNLYNMQTQYSLNTTSLDLEIPRCIINSNSRAITIPEEIKFFGVQYDHRSTSVFFEIDRIVDDTDLATQTCVVQWINGDLTTGNMGFFPVTNVDTSIPDKLVFEWEIYNESTQLTGDLHFSVRFYSMMDEKTFLYSYNTLPARSIILDTLDVQMTSTIEIKPSALEIWTERVSQLEIVARESIEISKRSAFEAEAWAHGRNDHPNTILDNALYYKNLTAAIYQEAKGSVELEKEVVVAEIADAKNQSISEIQAITDNSVRTAQQTGEEIEQNVLQYGVVQVSEMPPESDHVQVWIQPNQSEEYSLPEIKDDEINEVDTWSSHKIKTELDKIGDPGGSGGSGATEEQIAQIEQNKNDITQLKSDLTEEVTARKTADATEKAERKAEIAVERERINQFTRLNEGSTTGDAELNDARVDADGFTHANVGDHIRSVGNEVNDIDVEVFGTSYIPKLKSYNATISGSNVWSMSTNGANKCVFVPVNGGEHLEVVHKEGVTFHMAFLTDFTEPVGGVAPSFCSGHAGRIVIPVSDVKTEHEIPSDCKYIYIIVLNANADYSPESFVIDGKNAMIAKCEQIEGSANKYTDSKILEVNNDISENARDIYDLQKKFETSYDVVPTMQEGYTNHATGVISSYSGNGRYVTTGHINCPSDVHSIVSNLSNNAEAGYAFYDENKVFICGGENQSLIYPIPTNAKYISMSNYDENATHEGLKISFKNKPLVEIKNLVTCYGDSTVEGHGMNDIGNASYGGDTMPSHLYTLLKDGGYSVEVENMGHGGERSTETCARVGGRICAYLGEDITIPSTNVAQSLGVAVVNNHVVTGSKMLSTGKNADGTTPTVLLTKLGHHTRPILVGSYECNIWQESQDGGVIQTIQCSKPQGKEIVLKKYSPIVFGSSKRNPSLNIVHMGINDGSNMTLDEYVDRCNSIIERNPKTIICGLYNGAWRWWANMKGTTDDAKREEYNLACLSNFGSYFINLYDVFCTERCIDIAKEGGYLTDRTDAQIQADNTAFANGHTCPSLTYEGTEGEVHLNNIGYYVFAKVVYDKIVALGLIEKF